MLNKQIIINNVRFKNRISVSPMCQYSSSNGCPSNWHYSHLRNLIETGAGSITIESTAVSSIGRITKKDLCLYNYKHLISHKKLVTYLKNIRNIPIILQISHSGRKGSAEIPWIRKNKPLKKKHGWKTWAPSKLKRAKDWPAPKEMKIKDIQKVIKQFTNTSKLAFKAGYDGVEIHMAHGYLLHEFCSPVTNKRIDKYGLNSKNFKLPVDILKSIKKNLPKKKIIGARITATDHLSNGIKISDSISLVNKLKKNGLNYVCVSSGGIISKTNLKFYKGFRLKLANSIKKKCRIITRTSGMFNDFKTIKRAIKNYRIDFIALGRILIKDKYFLIKNKNFKINYEIKQYKYCLN